MSDDMDETLLDDESESDKEYDINGEEEDALLGDDDDQDVYKRTVRTENKEEDSEEDVLDLNIDFPEEILDYELEEESPKKPQKAVTPIRQEPIKPQKPAPITKNPEVKINTNTRVPQRVSPRNDTRKPNNFRGPNNYNRQNNYQRDRRTVLINPQYQGTVQVHDNSRLRGPVRQPYVKPWAAPQPADVTQLLATMLRMPPYQDAPRNVFEPPVHMDRFEAPEIYCNNQVQYHPQNWDTPTSSYPPQQVRNIPDFPPIDVTQPPPPIRQSYQPSYSQPQPNYDYPKSPPLNNYNNPNHFEERNWRQPYTQNSNFNNKPVPRNNFGKNEYFNRNDNLKNIINTYNDNKKAPFESRGKVGSNPYTSENNTQIRINNRKTPSESIPSAVVPEKKSRTESFPGVANPIPMEEEDEEMRKYRQRIEEQKKERERVLKRKEMRRKLHTASTTISVQNELVEKPAVAASPVRVRPIGTLRAGKPDAPMTFKVANNLVVPAVKVEQGFLSNRIVSIKGQTRAVVKVAPDADPGGSSSFLANRRIFTVDSALLYTRLLVVKNLSTGTNQSTLVSMSKGIGEIQKLEMDKQERQATILFKTVASAHAFYKKYQRYMLDLSMIEVKLEPMI